MEKDKRLTSGFTLFEVLIATAVSSVILGALLISVGALQKTFKASSYHSSQQVERLRYLDYLSLDLRRAIAQQSSTNGDVDTIEMILPDFYKDDPANPGRRIPRDPTLVNGSPVYGPNNVRIRYYKSGNSLFRAKTEVIGGTSQTETKELCKDVETFKVDYSRAGKVVTVSATFASKFQWGGDSGRSANKDNVTTCVTLLRNTQQAFPSP